MLTALTVKEVKNESKQRQCQMLSVPSWGNVPKRSDGQQNPLIKQSAEQQGTEARDGAGLGRAQRERRSLKPTTPGHCLLLLERQTKHLQFQSF